MHLTLQFLLLVTVATLLCANFSSRVESKKTIKSLLPTARHGSINNLTFSDMNGNINTSNVIHGRNNNVTARNKRTNNHNRIIGGHLARNHQFPFLVSIYLFNTFQCGGTLLRADWVLTAIHCLLHNHTRPGDPKILPIYFNVFAGHIDLKKVRFYGITPENPEMREVYETYLYEKFVSIFIAGDIGLMRLVSSFNLGKSIQLAPLDPQGLTKEYYEEQWIPCTVAGWGSSIDGTEADRRSASNLLRYADVNMISTVRCSQLWGLLDKDVQISNKFHICAQGRWEGPCVGDSGGPLLCGFYQVGVVSFGKDCARNPEVYTRIAPFRNWIDETISLHKDDVISRPRDSNASSTRIRLDACVVMAAIIMIVLSSNVLY